MCDYLYKDGHVCGKKLSPKYNYVACYKHHSKPRGHVPCLWCGVLTITPKGVCTACSAGDYIKAHRQRQKAREAEAKVRAELEDVVDEILSWDWGAVIGPVQSSAAPSTN